MGDLGDDVDREVGDIGRRQGLAGDLIARGDEARLDSKRVDRARAEVIGQAVLQAEDLEDPVGLTPAVGECSRARLLKFELVLRDEAVRDGVDGHRHGRDYRARGGQAQLFDEGDPAGRANREGVGQVGIRRRVDRDLIGRIEVVDRGGFLLERQVHPAVFGQRPFQNPELFGAPAEPRDGDRHHVPGGDIQLGQLGGEFQDDALAGAVQIEVGEALRAGLVGGERQLDLVEHPFAGVLGLEGRIRDRRKVGERIGRLAVVGVDEGAADGIEAFRPARSGRHLDRPAQIALVERAGGGRRRAGIAAEGSLLVDQGPGGSGQEVLHDRGGLRVDLERAVAGVTRLSAAGLERDRFVADVGRGDPGRLVNFRERHAEAEIRHEIVELAERGVVGERSHAGIV